MFYERASGREASLAGFCKNGLYELRSAVKILYHLRPKVSASSVSGASRVVNPKLDKLRLAALKELHLLHRKLWVYKISNN